MFKYLNSCLISSVILMPSLDFFFSFLTILKMDNIFKIAVCLVLLFAVFQAEGKCGVKPSSTRVVGGRISRPNAWPWMVQIINTKYGSNHHYCGAALIHPEWAVTATHCINRGDKSDYVFTVGEHDRFATEGPEQVFKAKRIIPRADYNSPVFVNNDIALVQLNRPVILNDRIGTICLPDQDYQIAVGSRCVTAGWGLTSGRGRQSRYLKQASMPIAPNYLCKKQYSITDQMVCGGSGGTSIENNCSSDSGGPLMCPKSDGTWALQGVVSFGDSQCRPGYYTVYARVSKFRNWIRKYTGV